MIDDGKRFEKAGDALLSKQAEIVSAMEPFSETPYGRFNADIRQGHWRTARCLVRVHP